MKSLFRKMVPGLNTTARFITKDLKRLNKTKADMGNQAVSYVLTGQPETVLSTLSVSGGGDVLNVCFAYGHFAAQNDIHHQRPTQILDLDPFDAALLSRYAKVLAAACGSAPGHAVGSDKVPDAMRILFSEAFIGAEDLKRGWMKEPRKAPVKGLTAERLLPVAQAVDGTTAQLFEILFWETNDYSTIRSSAFRQLVDLKSLVVAHGDAAIAGIVNCPAVGRERFIEALSKWNLLQDQPFLGFALDRVGDGSKAVREAAIRAVKGLPTSVIEPLAVDRLSKGTVNVRAGMVDILVGLDTKTATAVLESHAKTEKTARIVAAIENARSVTRTVSQTHRREDDATGYTAIDGTLVDVPPKRPLTDGPLPVLSPEDRAELKTLIEKENQKIAALNAENKANKYSYKQPLYKPSLVNKIEAFLTKEGPSDDDRNQSVVFLSHYCAQWTSRILEQLEQKPALKLAMKSMHEPSYLFYIHYQTPFSNVTESYLSSEMADLRAIDDLWLEQGLQLSLGGWRKRTVRKAIKGDLLRTLLREESYLSPDIGDLPANALWPYMVENFDVLDHALGLASNDDVSLSRVDAIKCLMAMPKPPMRYLGVLLEIATGERKAGKAEARQLLTDVAEVDGRLTTLLDDTRQAIRAGAAEWLGTRGEAFAIPPLKKRLKKEKSELAKAAMLNALQQLGEPLDTFVGPTALVREAEVGLKKAKFTKLDWLDLDHLPTTRFKNGKPVPADTLRWWIYLAFKLKQPGGNALFEIYLDQLDPESATAFSSWVFDSWVAHDTVVPSDEEANAYAEQNADQRQAMWQRWIKDYTREQAFAELKREKKSQYFNSGAATKGILGLASRVSAQSAAEKVRAYLRNHGSRTSQASSLLEVLANKGDPVSLQVVISAATRLKQKGVQTFAGELVQHVADKMNWSLEELADRTIPTAGLDDDGHIDLPCGPDAKLYRATLGDDLTFILKNPDGKVVKALSSGTDDHTKASKKQLSSSKNELKQVITMQTARLYEALCSQRIWSLADWQRDFRDHPIMRRLTERLVWQGLDGDGLVLAAFRPTAEGEYTDVNDDEVDVSGFSGVRLAHGTIMDAETASAWVTHLKDYEVKPLFAQFGRTLLRISEDQKEETHIMDREGWLTETFAIRGAANKLGYERGETLDGAWFFEYRKPFKGVGLTAVVEFTGNYLPEDNRKAALISLRFEPDSRRSREPTKLGDVPAVLLSECWNDLHAMAAKGAYDPEWKKTTQW